MRVPIVDYLILEPEPHLRAHECVSCKARYLGRRNACANCSGTDFADADVSTDGVLRTYTIVSYALPSRAPTHQAALTTSVAHPPPPAQVPFVAAIVDCGGTTVQGKLLNVTPVPDDVALGMPLRLATYSLGADASGVEAIGYGFEPVGGTA
jgi:uncharacterized OB-fold protein